MQKRFNKPFQCFNLTLVGEKFLLNAYGTKLEVKTNQERSISASEKIGENSLFKMLSMIDFVDTISGANLDHKKMIEQLKKEKLHHSKKAVERY